MTLSERLKATDGRPSGFDYLRFSLACMIVVWHTVITSYGIEAQITLILGPSRPIWALLLPMFFALSGFLISGSLERSRTLISFVGLRLIRLFPALAVESLIAMMIIGPIFTSYALDRYFIDPLFLNYALNTLGIVRYYLPGVFLDNPALQFNAQLWTLPFELKCYVAICIFYALRMYKSTFLFVVGCASLQISVVIWIHLFPQADEGVVRGPVLILAFLYGSLFYRLRDRVIWGARLFWLSLTASVILLYFQSVSSLSALPVAYLAVYLGLLNPRRSSIVSSGDYSYGIFLYGFPIQQAVSASFPDYRHWWVNLMVSAPLIGFVSYMSWNFIEKRALLLRRFFFEFESLCIPFQDRVATLYDQTVINGLKSRWIPKRLRQLELYRRRH